jgi:glyoxylate reductase
VGRLRERALGSTGAVTAHRPPRRKDTSDSGVTGPETGMDPSSACPPGHLGFAVMEGQEGRQWRTLVTREMPAPAMQRIRAACDVDVWEGPGPMPRTRLLWDLVGKDGALVTGSERVDDEFLDAAGEGLIIVANFGVGYDNVDVAACSGRGILVTNTPDVLTEATADLTWALLLATARRVGEGERFLRGRASWVWEPDFMLGQEVNGKVLGIVGFGRIGRAVASRARCFSMRILYHGRPRAPADVESALEAEYRQLDDLVAEADFITLHTPLTPETRHLIDARRLAMMKPTAIVVNASRGAVVDEAALVEALGRRQIHAAGLDVFEQEPELHPGLFELENVVLIPHLGSATVETRTAMALMAADNLIAALEGRRPPSLVNPDTWDRRRRLS